MTQSKRSSLLTSIAHIESLIRLIKHELLVDREIPSKQEVNSAIHELEVFRDLVDDNYLNHTDKSNNRDLHSEVFENLL